MPGRRCSPCQEVWPQSHEFDACPRCGGKTVYDTQLESPFTRDQAAAIRDTVVAPATAGTAATTGDVLHAHRVERYLELRDRNGAAFTEADAYFLAIAREFEYDTQGRVWERTLNHHRVAKAVRAGATVEQVMRIYA